MNRFLFALTLAALALFGVEALTAHSLTPILWSAAAVLAPMAADTIVSTVQARRRRRWADTGEVGA